MKRCTTEGGIQRIAGIDEVGRGPLAGPVVAAAVILPRQGIQQELFDSKQLSPKKRDDLYGVILSEALGVGMGIVGQETIDLLNILEATLEAMALAVKNSEPLSRFPSDRRSSRASAAHSAETHPQR